MLNKRMLHTAAWSCVLCLSGLARAQTETVTYVLDDVWLLPDITHPWEAAQQMTGTFAWTYEVDDFENGSGEFIELYTPWYNPGINNLNITVEESSIEFSLIGNWHDLGLDMTLRLLEPLSLDQPAAIDTVNSIFEIQQGVSRMGHVVSGSVVPIPVDCPVDLNGDGVSNLADHADFASCITGPGQPLVLECEVADMDGDGDADLADFAIVQTEMGCP